MTPEWIKVSIDIIQVITTVIVFIYAWQSNKHKASRAAIDDVDTKHSKQISDLRDRVLQAESAIQHMPDHDTLQRVHDRIDDVAEGISNVQGQTQQMNTTLRLIEQHLIGGGK